jgi:hypothetical protein
MSGCDRIRNTAYCNLKFDRIFPNTDQCDRLVSICNDGYRLEIGFPNVNPTYATNGIFL